MHKSLLRRRLATIGLFAPWLVYAQAPSARSTSDVLIGGTGSGVGPLQHLAESSGARHVRIVPNLGTAGGLRAIASGAIDIAVTARRLTEEEKGKGLVEREVFRTPIVWAVHEGVPQRHVTLQELASLYAARTTHWGGGQPVRLVLRPDTDSDTRFLMSLGPAMSEAASIAQARPGVRIATTDADATDALERIPGSLGVTTLGLLRTERRRVHVLELDGVAASTESLLARRYPYSKAIFVVTRAAPSTAVSDAIQAIAGRAAAPVLAAIGCVGPVPA